MSNEIQQLGKDKLPNISPFKVDYSTARIVQKISKNGNRYSVVELTLSPVDSEEKYIVEIWSNEYKSIVQLGFDIEGVIATPTLNQKTGVVSNIYTPFRSK